MDSKNTLKPAETESRLWTDAQILLILPVTVRQHPSLLSIPGCWCFIDRSWKDNEVFSGQGWYNTLEGYVGLMGAPNIRVSLSPLRSEMGALLWVIEHMRNLRQFRTTFAIDCSQLIKMVSEPEECLLLQLIWQI